jgi:putative flavoprotein involved in K+ transport
LSSTGRFQAREIHRIRLFAGSSEEEIEMQAVQIDEARNHFRADVERFPVIVIGAGQAGLSVGYHLARRNIPFVILDANRRIGEAWRSRWDSLRLFTPARYDGLDGMPFPAAPHTFPTKDEMADYLEKYATHLKLPVRLGVKVDWISRQNEDYLVAAGDQRFVAEHVVIAMANYQEPRVPGFACQLDKRIVQLHSRDYRNPAQLKAGDVLIVGAGNSGAEIAAELSRSHKVWVSGRDVGSVPFRIQGTLGRHFLAKFVLRFMFHRVLTLSTPIGRRARPKMIHQAAPLIRIQSVDLSAAGIERVPRVAGVDGGLPLLSDGRVLDVTNIVWCTGFRAASSWIELPIFDRNGGPLHERGVVTAEPGLYFVGLHFLYAFSSVMIHGVGRDADYVAAKIASRRGARRLPSR